LGPALLKQVFALSVDNRLADPASPLDFKTEYIVGLPHTLAQQRISADHLSQLVERVPSIKHTLLDIVSNVVALSTDQAKEILNQHFKEMKELSEENTDRQRLYKYAGMKVKESKAYFSLMMKSAFLNSLSQQ